MAASVRGIRRKKSSLSEVKLAVLGPAGVGKSALAVRFLTKRFIGEYDHQAETRYKSEVLVDGEPVIFEILDLRAGEAPREDVLQWADGLVLVYSVTDRASFAAVKDLRRQLTTGHPGPVLLLGNKSDLVHLREVSIEEGANLAKEGEDTFQEVSASEHVTQVSKVFCDLCREVQTFRRRSKQSLLDRVLGAKPPGPRRQQ